MYLAVRLSTLRKWSDVVDREIFMHNDSKKTLGTLFVAAVLSMLGVAGSRATGGEPGQLVYETPQGYSRPSFFGYYPNGVPYQNYPYFQIPTDSYSYHQPYYSARPAFGGGFYHPGTRVPNGMRPIGRGL